MRKMAKIRISDCFACDTFPCEDVQHEGYHIPDLKLNPAKLKILMISESAPADAQDYYYSNKQPAFEKTTIQAFKMAGLEVITMNDLLQLGIYCTISVKCRKTGYGIKAASIQNWSYLLEKEISLFPDLEVILLMGDVAIKALNTIARRNSGKRAIPAGSTYKLREESYYYNNIRLFPSYLQVGPSFGIEKSKQEMIAEDIRNALDYVSI